MSAEAPPQFIYKIIQSAPPEPLPAEWPLSELDQTDGFIHFSTAQQVPKTCDLFFSHVSDLWVLKVAFANVRGAIRWEGGFPHLYGNFGADEIVSSSQFSRNDTQKWSESMTGSAWLE